VSDRTWFIGSRRQYRTVEREPVRRLDPAEFRASADRDVDVVQRREYELEVLERVIADIRDPRPNPPED
jgi:hypothetical protein